LPHHFYQSKANVQRRLQLEIENLLK